MEIKKEQQTLQQVIKEAWENKRFKAELIANPLVVIEKLTGCKLNIPEGKTLVVRDQTSEDTVYINIPAQPKMEDVELNEEELEAVSGGCWNPSINKDLKLIFAPTTGPTHDAPQINI